MRGVPTRLRRAADRAADKVSEAIAWRVTLRLASRGVRVVSPAPWNPAIDRERARLDHRLILAAITAALPPRGSFLDVGAHEGEMLAQALRVAPEGAHVAWEPLPHLEQGLRERFPSAQVRGAALADGAGDADFLHLMDRPGQSGFRDRDFPADVRRETITVRTERLDDVLDPSIVPAIVKVDVEGAELGVFRGGLETLARHRPCVLFEHGMGGAEYYDTLPEHVFELLCGQAGLRIFDMDGEGPYTIDQFVDAVGLRARWNWLARP